MVGPMRQTHEGQGLARGGPSIGAGHPPVQKAFRNVGEGRFALQEVELLKDKTDPPRPERGQLSVRETAYRMAGHAHLAVGRAIECSHQVEKGGLAGA